MARHKILTKPQRGFIAQLKLAARNDGVKLTAADIIRQLNNELAKRSRRLRTRMRPERISPSAIQKFISEINPKLKDYELDKPWHLGLMCNPKYAIHPEAIPHVIRVQLFHQGEDPDYRVSIRQAQWIGILYAAVPEVEHLYFNSTFYALYENICYLARIAFETSKADMMLPDSDKVKDAFIELLLQEDG